ncbi:uncharacterized protein LTR77_008495 [Saxophila tyrrhenica]|uniref:DUF2423 domain-containing protein n=1 Tax=Saxophila tyrrhenica TaxID=1690608 RepID=A0AAV9P143_9PEZI|nr:hypothetical protein LTR77_008495 [Saxophila tyrrhenica]
MAKSARASVKKRNNQALKRKVFGPAETARNDRLSAKLMELAQQPKPPRPEMDVEEEGEQHYAEIPRRVTGQESDTIDLTGVAPEAKEDDSATQDIDMDANRAAAKPAERSNKSLKREKENKAAKIEKKRIRKPRNRITFAKHPKKAGGKKR